jgi:hypothetical protein
MAHRTHVEGERVSPSMVQSVFGELKSNGYTDGQIIALSRELTELAHRCSSQAQAQCVPSWHPAIGVMNFEVDLSQLGL